MKFSIIFTAVFLFNFCDAYNILTFMPFDGMSHFEAYLPLFETLGEIGHNLTIISYYRYPFKSKNVRTVWLEKEGVRHAFSLQEKVSNLRQYLGVVLLAELSAKNCQNGLKSKNFQKFLRENNTYDVILMEFFVTDCFFGVLNKFKAPMIGLSSCNIFPWQLEWFGAPQNPAYNQVIFMGYKTPMSFLARVENTLLQVFDNIWYKYGMEKPGRELSKKYIGYYPPDPHNASLILINTHYTLHGVRPLTPNIIEVGGIHVSNRKPKKLPEAIESWINNSDAGVIYFSLGSMIKGDTFPEEQRKAFTRAFSKLPQRVLWKWENDTMQDKPDNVLIAKWMPQFDILCAPNIKAFISHGGLLGVTEAVHCGVPIIVMPQFGDQRHNAHAIENSGSGVILYLHDATEESVLKALQYVLKPQTFKNAKTLSARFRDRPLSPMDTAVYWIEHVARHKGADHMKSPAINMPFYQYFLLDVIAFIAIVALAHIYLFFTIINMFAGLLVHSKKEVKKKLS